MRCCDFCCYVQLSYPSYIHSCENFEVIWQRFCGFFLLHFCFLNQQEKIYSKFVSTNFLWVYFKISCVCMINAFELYFHFCFISSSTSDDWRYDNNSHLKLQCNPNSSVFLSSEYWCICNTINLWFGFICTLQPVREFLEYDS